MSVNTQPETRVRPVKQIQLRPAPPPRAWDAPVPDGAELMAPSAAMPWPAQIVFWTGIAAIVAAGFGLQVVINGLGRNPAETVLVVVSVALEFGLLWLWNRRFPAFWTRIVVGGLRRLLR